MTNNCNNALLSVKEAAEAEMVPMKQLDMLREILSHRTIYVKKIGIAMGIQPYDISRTLYKNKLPKKVAIEFCQRALEEMNGSARALQILITQLESL